MGTKTQAWTPFLRAARRSLQSTVPRMGATAWQKARAALRKRRAWATRARRTTTRRPRHRPHHPAPPIPAPTLPHTRATADISTSPRPRAVRVVRGECALALAGDVAHIARLPRAGCRTRVCALCARRAVRCAERALGALGHGQLVGGRHLRQLSLLACVDVCALRRWRGERAFITRRASGARALIRCAVVPAAGGASA